MEYILFYILCSTTNYGDHEFHSYDSDMRYLRSVIAIKKDEEYFIKAINMIKLLKK